MFLICCKHFLLCVGKFKVAFRSDITGGRGLLINSDIVHKTFLKTMSFKGGRVQPWLLHLLRKLIWNQIRRKYCMFFLIQRVLEMSPHGVYQYYDSFPLQMNTGRFLNKTSKKGVRRLRGILLSWLWGSSRVVSRGRVGWGCWGGGGMLGRCRWSAQGGSTLTGTARHALGSRWERSASAVWSALL